MGRQSSRIYFNGHDHKEMVIWDGSQYVYHDKAYIWNGSEYELVWQKLKYGLKLLYESNLALQPVASKNNKYLYFTEGGNGSVIYWLAIDADNPQKREFYSSDLYDAFSAPMSSQGIGLYSHWDSITQVSYRIIAFDELSISGAKIFNAIDEGCPIPPSGRPADSIGITQQDLSIGETGNPYTTVPSLYMDSNNQLHLWNVWIYGFVDGITFYPIDQVALPSTGAWYSLGRYESELLPRFVSVENLGTGNDSLVVWRFGTGTQYGVYTKSFESALPFTINTYPGVLPRNVIEPRDNKMGFHADDGHIWIAEIGENSISYTDTGVVADECALTGIDISPDFKYVIYNEGYQLGNPIGMKIVEIATKDVIVDFDSDADIWVTYCRFVGEKCVYAGGYASYPSDYRHRLYKWR